jgi:hypothetical protein
MSQKSIFPVASKLLEASIATVKVVGTCLLPDVVF